MAAEHRIYIAFRDEVSIKVLNDLLRKWGGELEFSEEFGVGVYVTVQDREEAKVLDGDVSWCAGCMSDMDQKSPEGNYLL